ncbi:MAG: hypothetical protein K6T94_22440 [Paenibacillus sp.]|nr:hypothetical protein [Paenibacillus sp.]
MTILVSTYIQEGIVMGSDSRLTCTDHDLEGSPKTVQSDNMNKLFLLKKVPYGLSSSGEAYVNKRILSDYIRVFDNEYLNEDDSVEEVCLKFMKYLNETLDTAIMSVQICGYFEGIPYVFLVDRFSCQRFNHSQEGKVIYNLLWHGDADGVSNLLQGPNPMKIDFHFMPLGDAIDLTEFLIDIQIKFGRFKKGYSSCGGPIDLLILTKDEQFFYRHKQK